VRGAHWNAAGRGVKLRPVIRLTCQACLPSAVTVLCTTGQSVVSGSVLQADHMSRKSSLALNDHWPAAVRPAAHRHATRRAICWLECATVDVDMCRLWARDTTDCHA